MAHFYGKLSGNRGETSKLGTKQSGIQSYVASYEGAIKVHLYVNAEGKDCYTIEQTTHEGAGVNRVIARGVIGEE